MPPYVGVRVVSTPRTCTHRQFIAENCFPQIFHQVYTAQNARKRSTTSHDTSPHTTYVLHCVVQCVHIWYMVYGICNMCRRRRSTRVIVCAVVGGTSQAAFHSRRLLACIAHLAMRSERSLYQELCALMPGAERNFRGEAEPNLPPLCVLCYKICEYRKNRMKRKPDTGQVKYTVEAAFGADCVDSGFGKINCKPQASHRIIVL